MHVCCLSRECVLAGLYWSPACACVDIPVYTRSVELCETTRDARSVRAGDIFADAAAEEEEDASLGRSLFLVVRFVCMFYVSLRISVFACLSTL